VAFAATTPPRRRPPRSLALAERPDQLAQVKADRALIPGLVEESIRWTTPIYQFVRVAERDAEVGGQTVRKGEQVVLSFPSGCRDEDAFEEPFAFRVDRTPNRHLAFGYGPHQCLGMHLARMEMSIFFEELLPAPQVGRARRPAASHRHQFRRRPKTLPLRYQ